MSRAKIFLHPFLYLPSQSWLQLRILDIH